MKNTIKLIACLFVVLCIILLPIIYMVVKNNESEKNSFYPYNDCTYLNVSNISKADIDNNLSQKCEKIIYEAVNEPDNLSSDYIDFISKKQYNKLCLLAKANDAENSYSIESFHISYINALTNKNKAVVSFSTNFVGIDDKSGQELNKIYLEKINSDWTITDIFILM